GALLYVARAGCARSRGRFLVGRRVCRRLFGCTPGRNDPGGIRDDLELGDVTNLLVTFLFLDDLIGNALDFHHEHLNLRIGQRSAVLLGESWHKRFLSLFREDGLERRFRYDSAKERIVERRRGAEFPFVAVAARAVLPEEYRELQALVKRH